MGIKTLVDRNTKDEKIVKVTPLKLAIGYQGNANYAGRNYRYFVTRWHTRWVRQGKKIPC